VDSLKNRLFIKFFEYFEDFSIWIIYDVVMIVYAENLSIVRFQDIFPVSPEDIYLTGSSLLNISNTYSSGKVPIITVLVIIDFQLLTGPEEWLFVLYS
jgi:hypothetical protein